MTKFYASSHRIKFHHKLSMKLNKFQCQKKKTKTLDLEYYLPKMPSPDTSTNW